MRSTFLLLYAPPLQFVVLCYVSPGNDYAKLRPNFPIKIGPKENGAEMIPVIHVDVPGM